MIYLINQSCQLSKRNVSFFIPNINTVIVSIFRQLFSTEHANRCKRISVLTDESSPQATDHRCSFPSYHHGPLAHHGAVIHLLPPMPDVVPQDNHLFHVCALRQDPNAVTTHNPLLHCLDSIHPAPPTPIPSPPLVAPRCASVPLGLPVENNQFCPVHPYHPRCTDSYFSRHNLDRNDRSRWHIPATAITTYNHNRNPEFSTHRSAVYVGHSTPSAGPVRSDSAGFVHDQLSLLARRMADIGDELVAQNNARGGGRYSLVSRVVKKQPSCFSF